MVSKNSGKTKKDVEEWTKIIFDGIKESLRLYGGVKIVNFGKFTIRERKGRMGKNPNTKEDLYIEGRKTVHFDPGNEIKKLVNY